MKWADWANPSDPAYLGLLCRGAVPITTFKMPLHTPCGVTTRAFVWECPDCGKGHNLSVAQHPVVQPAEIGQGVPAVIRAPFDSEKRLHCGCCGTTWEPHMLAPYDRALDQYQLVCTRSGTLPLFPHHLHPESTA